MREIRTSILIYYLYSKFTYKFLSELLKTKVAKRKYDTEKV